MIPIADQPIEGLKEAGTLSLGQQRASQQTLVVEFTDAGEFNNFAHGPHFVCRKKGHNPVVSAI